MIKNRIAAAATLGAFALAGLVGTALAGPASADTGTSSATSTAGTSSSAAPSGTNSAPAASSSASAADASNARTLAGFNDAQSRRSLDSDDSKAMQTNIRATQDAAKQQADLSQSLVDQMNAITSAIFR